MKETYNSGLGPYWIKLTKKEKLKLFMNNTYYFFRYSLWNKKYRSVCTPDGWDEFKDCFN